MHIIVAIIQSMQDVAVTVLTYMVVTVGSIVIALAASFGVTCAVCRHIKRGR